MNAVCLLARQIRTDLGVELVKKLLESPVTRGHLLQPVDVPRQNTRFSPSCCRIGPLLQPIHLEHGRGSRVRSRENRPASWLTECRRPAERPHHHG